MAFRSLLRQVAKGSQVFRTTALPVLAGSMTPTMQRLGAVASAQFVSKGAFVAAPWMGILAAAAAATPIAMASSSEERSFIMIKPDGVHRGLVADIIKRFEKKGYQLVGIKVLVPSEDLAGNHYADLAERPFYPKLVKFLASGPVVAMVWQGKDVIKYGRTLIGATNPLASAPGTIRGDFGIDVGRNVIHGSDSVESAQKEIALWFDPSELAQWEPVSKVWIYE